MFLTSKNNSVGMKLKHFFGGSVPEPPMLEVTKPMWNYFLIKLLPFSLLECHYHARELIVMCNMVNNMMKLWSEINLSNPICRTQKYDHKFEILKKFHRVSRFYVPGGNYGKGGSPTFSVTRIEGSMIDTFKRTKRKNIAKLCETLEYSKRQY